MSDELTAVLDTNSAEEFIAAAKSAGINVTEADVALITQNAEGRPWHSLLKIVIKPGRLTWRVDDIQGRGNGPPGHSCVMSAQIPPITIPPAIRRGLYILKATLHNISLEICNKDGTPLQTIALAVSIPWLVGQWEGKWSRAVGAEDTE